MNLFICWNTFSILEFLATTENYNEYFIHIDKNYNKKNIDDIRNIVDKFIENNIFLGYMENIYDNDYENIAMTSDLNQYNLNILNKVKYNNLKLLEEGFSDYLKTGIGADEYKICKRAILYVNNINGIKNIFAYKSVYQIHFKTDILDLFFKILNFNVKDLNSKIDLVFFTSPMNDDYNYFGYPEKIVKYLNENYEGKNILLKKHPRDYNNYDGNYNLIEVDKMVPGQFIDLNYDCDKLYAHPSTVILSSKKFDNIHIFRFNDLNNFGYERTFNYTIMKKCNIIDT